MDRFRKSGNSYSRIGVVNSLDKRAVCKKSRITEPWPFEGLDRVRDQGWETHSRARGDNPSEIDISDRLIPILIWLNRRSNGYRSRTEASGSFRCHSTIQAIDTCGSRVILYRERCWGPAIPSLRKPRRWEPHRSLLPYRMIADTSIWQDAYVSCFRLAPWRRRVIPIPSEGMKRDTCASLHSFFWSNFETR